MYHLRTFAIRILSLVLLLGGACAPATPPASQPVPPTAAEPTPSAVFQPREIKIGAVFDQSGENAGAAAEIRNGLELAVAHINAAGGILALGGSTLALVTADSQGLPQSAADAVTRLAQQDLVTAIITADRGKAAMAAAQEAERLRVPLLAVSGAANQLTDGAGGYVFRLNPSARQAATSLAGFLQALPGLSGAPVQRAALLTQAGGAFDGDSQTLKTALADAGIETAVESAFTAGAGQETSLAAGLEAIQQAGVDVVLVFADSAALPAVVRARQAAGLLDPFFVSADAGFGADTPEQLAALLADPALGGWFGIQDYISAYPTSSNLRTLYKTRYNQELSRWSIYPYQAAWVIAGALEKAVSTDRGAVREALAGLTLESGPRMPLSAASLAFDDQGQNEFAPLFIAQAQAGKLVTIWPAAYQAGTILTSR